MPDDYVWLCVCVGVGDSYGLHDAPSGRLPLNDDLMQLSDTDTCRLPQQVLPLTDQGPYSSVALNSPGKEEWVMCSPTWILGVCLIHIGSIG